MLIINNVIRTNYRNFFFFSSDWKYRNDIDTIGVRFGCTFTGFTSTEFSGNKMIITADSTDRYFFSNFLTLPFSQCILSQTRLGISCLHLLDHPKLLRITIFF